MTSGDDAGAEGRSAEERARDFDRVAAKALPLLAPLTRWECTRPPPEGRSGVLVACNHRSLFDALAIFEMYRTHGLRLRTVSAAHLWDNPRLGSWLDRLGAIPLGSGRDAQRAIETAAAGLQQGENVVVTPEGRIVPPEERVDGVAQGGKIISRIATAADVPVTPLVMVGTTAVWPLGRRLPRFTPWRRPLVRYAYGAARRYEGPDHRANTDQTMADMVALLGELEGRDAPDRLGAS